MGPCFMLMHTTTLSMSCSCTRKRQGNDNNIIPHFADAGIGSTYMSLVMRKPFFFCICKNKDADQLRSTCAADQRLCFRYLDSTIPPLSKSESSSLYSHLLWLYSLVCAGPGRKSRRPVFSLRGSYMSDFELLVPTLKT